MNPLQTARRHLDKARELLDAAEVSLDLDMFNAAVSNAVVSAINSKDAICLRLTGRTLENRNHVDAAKELNQVGNRACNLNTDADQAAEGQEQGPVPKRDGHSFRSGQGDSAGHHAVQRSAGHRHLVGQIPRSFTHSSSPTPRRSQTALPVGGSDRLAKLAVERCPSPGRHL